MTLDTTSVSGLDRQPTVNLAVDRRHWITLLVDRSSSMEELRDATVAGLNTFIREHAHRSNTRLRVVEFGTNDANELQLTLMFSNEWAAASEGRALRRLDYRPRGGTPLLAAVLQTI